MKTKQIFALLTVCTALAGCQQDQQPATDLFTPYAPTELRLPSVPIVVNDPYFSIWSPYDKLTDGPTRHWTDDEKPLLGLLRVD